MMETVNASRAINQPFAVIDGGLSIKNGTPTTPTVQKPKLLDQVREAIRTRHYSPKTEESYVHWVKRFIFFHNKRHPAEMGERKLRIFFRAWLASFMSARQPRIRLSTPSCFCIATCSARRSATSKVSSARKDRTGYRSF